MMSDASEDVLQLVVTTTAVVHCFFWHLSETVTSVSTVWSSCVSFPGRREMVKLRVVATADVRRGHPGRRCVISKCGRVSLSKNGTTPTSSYLVDVDACSSAGRIASATSAAERWSPLPAGLPQPRPVSFKNCLWVTLFSYYGYNKNNNLFVNKQIHRETDNLSIIIYNNP